jgi:alpha-tubulin suppressor-like RCC1 family protein
MNNHLAAALDNNGTLTTWALQNSNTVVVTPLSNVAQFALGDSSNQHLLTLSTTGVITDYTPAGATTVAITDAVAIAVGTTHNLAIIKTGQLVAWGGSNSNGETTIPDTATMGISQIAAGDGFSLALKSNGRLITWGKNDLGQITVPVSATTGITQIAAGDKHGLALRADGVVVAWGDNSRGQTTIPVSVTNALYIAANANSSAAVTRDGKLYVWGATTSVESCCYGTTTVALNGTQILTSQVVSSTSQSSNLPASLDLLQSSNQFTGLLPGRRYKYTLTVSTSAGSAAYSGTFTPTQSYDKLYLPFLTNTDGATTVNTTSGK